MLDHADIETAEIVEDDESLETNTAARKADNPWVLLATLFFVTAALGLPFLWVSRAFSTPLKVLLTLVVLIYTAAIFWGFYLIMAICYTRIADSLGW